MLKSHDLNLSALIIDYLIKLPSDTFKDLQLTPAQEIYWESMRQKSSLQGLHWRSLLNLGNDPLIALEEQGVINKWQHIGIIRYVNFYQKLWELVHVSEHYVSKFYKKKQISYPFESDGSYSAACLFMKILKDLIDGEFSNCLIPYHKFSLQDTSKLAKYVQDKGNSKPHQKKEVMAILKKNMQSKDNSWLILLLNLCEEKRKQDPVVEMRLKAVWESIQEVAKHQETTSKRKRNSSNFNKPVSYEWRNGEYFPGSSSGGTYA